MTKLLSIAEVVKKLVTGLHWSALTRELYKVWYAGVDCEAADALVALLITTPTLVDCVGRVLATRETACNSGDAPRVV